MLALNPYLIFNGKAEEAFLFYQSVMGGNFTEFHYHNNEDEKKNQTTSKNSILHITFKLPNGSILMGCDKLEADVKMGDNCPLFISTESEEEIQSLSKALSADGIILVELQKTIWNAYFSSFIDKFGVSWMLNYEIPKAS